MQKAISFLQRGKFIIITDDKDRENEADLTLAAEFVTEENINFMINTCSGIICVPMTLDRASKLNLTPMVEHNTDKFHTPFLISVDSKDIQDGGVSARDRTLTIKKLVNGHEQDFGKPGHVFPLFAKKEGLLERQGHTEASVDLLKIANLKPTAVICELMNKDGTMMRGQELQDFSKNHDIPVVSVSEIKHFLQR